jgi:hypothetical protein
MFTRTLRRPAPTALPVLDRSREPRPRRRKCVTALVLSGGLSMDTLMMAFSGSAIHLG